MSKYASLLFPTEDYHEIGPFRFPIFHDLVPGEAKGLESISKKQARHTFNSIKLAQRIAKDRDITTKEAIDLLADGESNEEIFYEYANELDELQQLSMGAVETKVAAATLVLKYRGEVKAPNTDEWQKVPDWTEQDTEKIPSKFLDGIYQFMEWERSEWPAEGKPEDEAKASSPPQSRKG